MNIKNEYIADWCCDKGEIMEEKTLHRLEKSIGNQSLIKVILVQKKSHRKDMMKWFGVEAQIRFELIAPLGDERYPTRGCCFFCGQGLRRAHRV